MAISLKTAGTWARMVTDGGTVAIPGTPAAGDRMFLFGTWKDFAITVANPSGWTPIGSEFADGAVNAGNGTGSVKVMAWYRDWQSGDAAPVIDYSSAPTEGHWVIMLWQKAGGDLWGAPLDATAAITAVDPFSATSSGTVDVPDASVVMALVGLRDDSTTLARTTTAIADDGSPALTWNGNYVESPATHFNSTTGFDMSGDLGHRLVTTGAAGVNLVVTGDPAAAETGAAKFVVQGLAASPSGTSAISLATATASSSGTEVFAATSGVTLPALAAAAAGGEVFGATAAITLPAATVAGVGDHAEASAPVGTSAVNLAALTTEASGVEVLTGSGAILGSPAAVSGVGDETLPGSGGAVGRAPVVAASGWVESVGAGAVALPSLAVFASGTVSGIAPTALAHKRLLLMIR